MRKCNMKVGENEVEMYGWENKNNEDIVNICLNTIANIFQRTL